MKFHNVYGFSSSNVELSTGSRDLKNVFTSIDTRQVHYIIQ